MTNYSGRGYPHFMSAISLCRVATRESNPSLVVEKPVVVENPLSGCVDCNDQSHPETSPVTKMGGLSFGEIQENPTSHVAKFQSLLSRVRAEAPPRFVDGCTCEFKGQSYLRLRELTLAYGGIPRYLWCEQSFKDLSNAFELASIRAKHSQLSNRSYSALNYNPRFKALLSHAEFDLIGRYPVDPFTDLHSWSYQDIVQAYHAYRFVESRPCFRCWTRSSDVCRCDYSGLVVALRRLRDSLILDQDSRILQSSGDESEFENAPGLERQEEVRWDPSIFLVERYDPDVVSERTDDVIEFARRGPSGDALSVDRWLDPASLKRRVVERVRFYQLCKLVFPAGVDSFLFDAWKPLLFDDWKDSEIIGICLKPKRYTLAEVHSALIEAVVRGFNADVFKAMASSVIKFEGRKKRHSCRVGSKAWKRSQYKAWGFRVLSPDYKAYVETTKPDLPDVFVSDYLVPSRALAIRSMRFSSHSELAKCASIFSRDKPLFRHLMTTTDWDEGQKIINQKIFSDPEFRRRCIRFEEAQLVGDRELQSSRGVFIEMDPPRTTEASRLIRAGLKGHPDALEYSRLLMELEYDLEQARETAEGAMSRKHSYGEFDEISKKSGAEILKQFGRLVATMDLIFKAKSGFEILEILFLFLSDSSISSVCLELRVWFTESFESFLQSDDETTLEDLTQEALAMLGVSNVFASILSFAVEPGMPNLLSPILFLKNRFVALAKMQAGDDKLRKFWNTFTSFLGTLRRCFIEKTLDPLFTKTETPSQILAMAEALHDYRNVVCVNTLGTAPAEFVRLRDEGRLPKSWVRPWIPAEYFEECQKVLIRMDEVIPLVASSVSSLYKAARDRLHIIVSTSVDAFEANSYRTPPLGVAFTGAPGVGKSVLMKQVAASVGARAKYPVDASAVYNWKMNVNFQDGLTSAMWIYFMDDLDNSLVAPLRGVEDHTQSIMRVCDSKPFPIESADVTLKGKNFGRPLLVLYATNNEDLKLSTFIQDPSAIRRRLPIRARVRAHPDYAIGLKGVDFVKAEAANDPNVHEIDVDLYDKVEMKYVFYKTMTDSQFIKYVGDRFLQNLSLHGGRVARDIPLCDKCCTVVPRGVTRCSECSQELQGGGASRLANLADRVETMSVRGDALLGEIEDSQVISKADRVFTKLDQLTSGAAAVGSSARYKMASMADWFLSPPAAAIALIGTVIVCVKIFSSTLQGRVNNSTQVLPENFVRVSTDKPLGQPFKSTTYTKDQLLSAVSRNIGVVGGGSKGDARALRVGNDLFLLNHHVLAGAERYRLEFEGLSYQGGVDESNFTQIGLSDTALLKVAGVPAAANSLPYFWPAPDSSYSTFDAVFLLKGTELYPASKNRIISESGWGYKGLVVEYDVDTVGGDCGFPIIAVSGDKCRIVGIHHSQRTGLSLLSGFTALATGPLVSAYEIKLAASRLKGDASSASVLNSCFPGGLIQTDLKPSTSSELALSLEACAHVVNRGHDASARGSSSMKSTCRLSPYYEEAEVWCSQETGVRHYFQVPKLKGAMLPVEGGQKWFSPYQNIHKHYRPIQDYPLMYYPILDYLEPLREADITGYEMLSEEEAILGVESSVIGSINLKTSVGPPIGGPKSNHVHFSGSTSPVFRTQLDEIHSCLSRGELPIPLAHCTLKDEPIKHSKNDLRDVRVFMCLPAAWNVVSKMYLGPIKSFMRANTHLTESMVGVNLTGRGAAEVVTRLASVNPKLDLIVEGDYTKMDKTINGVLGWAVSEVFMEIAELLGLDPIKVGLMVRANFHVMYSIQGDLFQVGGMNPSGSDVTVEINAVVNSLAHRAAFLLNRGVPSLSHQSYVSGLLPECYPRFRDSNVLLTYGDDFLLAHGERVDLAKLFKSFDATGMQVTDGQKLKDPVYRPIQEVYFLKRRFFLEGEIVYAGLDMRSILRMLMVHKKSTLSDVDHAAVVLEEALREIFLRRDQDFNLWRDRFSLLAAKYKLTGSRYLQLAHREHYSQLWEEGTFTPWVTGLPMCEYVVKDEALFSLNSKMSTSLDIVPALGGISAGAQAQETSIVAHNHATGGIVTPLSANTYGAVSSVPSGGTNLVHSTGDVITNAGPVMAGGLGVRQRDQTMADVDLGSFLSRAVNIATYTDFSSESEDAFYPWREWRSNAFVEDKLKNFNFITGGMRLRGVLETPPMCSGLIVVTAFPACDVPATAQPCPQELQTVGLHAVVDMSNSSAFELTLPWVVASNWGNLYDDSYETSWLVTVRVTTRLRSTIPEGCVTATLKLYALPADDFQLSGAKLQSSRNDSMRGGFTRKTETRSITGSVPSSSQHVGPQPKILQDAAGAVEKKTGYKPSQILSSGAVASGIAAMVPTPLTPYFAGASAGMGALATVLDYFGMTRQSKAAPVDDAQLRVAGNLINCDGTDSSRISGLFGSNGISQSVSITGSLAEVDECSVSFIGGKYTWLGEITYVVGSNENADVLIPVTPYLFSNTGGGTMIPTTAGYVGARFRQWRGDVKFLFYPVVAATQRGALQFIWQPIPTDVPASTVDFTNIGLNSIVDVQPARAIEVKVGYQNDYPALDQDFYELTSPVTDVDYRTLNGYLRVRNVIPFTGPICGQEIRMHIFAACGDNMEFFGPSDTFFRLGVPYTFGAGAEIIPTLQSTGVVGTEGQGLLSIDLVPSSGVYPLVENLAGEAVRSIRALCQKPSVLIGEGPVGPQSETGVFQVDHGPYTGFSAVNYMKYYGTMYLGYAGSTRYKTVVDRRASGGSSVSGLVLSPAIVPEYLFSSDQAGALPVGEFSPIVTEDSVTAEYTMPYYHKELYIPAYKASERKDSLVWQNSLPVDHVLSMAKYKSAGPDARYSFFRAQNAIITGPMTPGLSHPRIFESATPYLAPGLLAERSTSGEDPQKLKWYRARTGRSSMRNRER
uniref:Polyprotein n=1 Tax=Red panda picorna-like virus TaxID=2864000 RepID=A0A8K1M3V5_9VIRU|nr:hypothetical protein [Red panda picorna-like virus]